MITSILCFGVCYVLPQQLAGLSDAACSNKENLRDDSHTDTAVGGATVESTQSNQRGSSGHKHRVCVAGVATARFPLALRSTNNTTHRNAKKESLEAFTAPQSTGD